MNGTTASQEAEKIVAELPERISDVIKPFACHSPDHPALAQGDVTWSYSELAAVVADTTLILKHYDIRPGDRVMIISENSLALVALILAIAELDAWSVVANPRLSAREIDLIREHSGARRVFYTIKVSDAARQHAERHEADIAVLRGLGTLGVGPLNRDTVPEPVEVDRSRQIAALIYTSGTTGNPKGVMLTHRNLLFSARVTSALRDPTDKAYCVLPISHIVGYSAILIASLMVGATAQLVPHYDPAALVSAIANDGITLIFGVPATYQRLLEYKAVAGIEKLPRGKLRRLAVAGAPLDVALKSRIEAEFGMPLGNGYGITECAPAIAGARTEAPRSDDAVGSLISGIDARLVKPGGGAVAPGEIGELHVRGPNVMRGYYRNPEATAAAIDADGWFNTGDLARFEGDILYIVGRTKELIIRSGFNVYPPEVQAVLNEHPAVVQSAVIGRSVPGNEEVVAFVQLVPGSTATQSGPLQRSGEAMPKVEFHFDFGSPNAYLAHLVIPEIERRTGAKFEYVPVLLGGVYKLTGNRSPAESLVGVKNKPDYERLETARFIKRHGITRFRQNPFFPVNTLTIMRGAIAAQRLGVFERYVDEIYRHIWSEPKKLDDPAVLREALLDSGFDAERIAELVQDPEVKARLLENTERSVARGTFGSPTFFVGDEIFFGKDRLRDVEEAIIGTASPESRQSRPLSGGSNIDVILKRFEQPDEVRTFEKGKFEIIRIGGMTIGRATYEPGWKWSLHVGPATGASSCAVEHVGIVVSGRATAAMDNGTINEMRPGDVFHIAPGHDSWVIGDEPYVSLHFLGADHYADRS